MSKPRYLKRVLFASLLAVAALVAAHAPTHGQEVTVPSKPADSKRELGSKVVNKPDLRVGDSWNFLYPYTQRTSIKRIKAIQDGLVHVTERTPCRFETMAYTLEWGQIDFCGVSGSRSVKMIYHPPLRYIPFPVNAGQQWPLEYGVLQTKYYAEGKAIGWETVTVPAGTFEALKIEVNRTMGGAKLKYTLWYAPLATHVIRSNVFPEPQRDFELVSYTRGNQPVGK